MTNWKPGDKAYNNCVTGYMIDFGINKVGTELTVKNVNVSRYTDEPESLVFEDIKLATPRPLAFGGIYEFPLDQFNKTRSSARKSYLRDLERELKHCQFTLAIIEEKLNKFKKLTI